MDDEKLIECVRKYAAIYDMAHPKYFDNNHKSSLWKKIAEEVKESDAVCKKRWINIRDQFKKSLKRRKTKSGQAADPTHKKYKYEETLQFLMPHIQDRNTVSNVDPPTENDGDSFTEPCSQSSADTDEGYGVNSNYVETHLHQPILKKKRKKTKPESASAVLMKYINEHNSQQNTGNDKHHIDAFLEGLAPTLKNLPPYYQHLAKGRLFSVVQDMEAAAFYNSFSQSATPQSINSDGSSCSNEQPPSQNIKCPLKVQSPAIPTCPSSQ